MKLYQYDELKKTNQALGSFKRNGVKVDDVKIILVEGKLQFFIVAEPPFVSRLEDEKEVCEKADGEKADGEAEAKKACESEEDQPAEDKKACISEKNDTLNKDDLKEAVEAKKNEDKHECKPGDDCCNKEKKENKPIKNK